MRAIQQAIKGATKIGEHALNEAKTRHARNAKFGQAVQRPLLDIIKNDPAARAALGGTRLESFVEVSPPRLGRAPSLLSLTLHESLNVTSAPYDFEWHWGNSFQDIPNRKTGRMAILGKAGDEPGGVREPVRSACGVGVLLRSNSPSFVSVRPLVAYQYEFITQSNGLWIGASSRGGIDISAWQGPTMVAGVRRSELWSSSVYSGVGDGYEAEAGSDGGFAWVPDLEIKFSMQPDLDYVVNVGAYVECDLSSELEPTELMVRLTATCAFLL